MLVTVWPPTRLSATLLAWYDRARRDLPWRAPAGAGADPWHILISEVMLQQTTVATVRSRFAPFVARFPTPATMAAAPLDAVLHAWAGLGYYRRARALHACAQAIARDHAGDVPAGLAELRALPGLGAYTAAAVAAIAFGQAAVPVDSNVARVLARLHGLEVRSVRELERLAAALVVPERAADLAQALMELGALVCTPRRPACRACPWRAGCAAAATGAPETFPRKLVRRARPVRHAVAFLLQRSDGAILLRRRPAEGLLGGMVDLPSTTWSETAPDAASIAAARPVPADWTQLTGTVRHVFTHFALEMTVQRATIERGPDGLWRRPDELADLALPTLTTRLLAHAGLGPAAAAGARRRGDAPAGARG